jgi:hypothetical protein
MANKPIVFISHITAESELAMILKNHLSQAFLGMVEVFVSSDEQSIAAGDSWFRRINEALEASKLTLILCSSVSVQRPWINFEAGACSVREIPMIPICHSNFRPEDLPLPLGLYQAIEAKQESDLEPVIQQIALLLEFDAQAIDLKEFVAEIQAFEQEYLATETDTELEEATLYQAISAIASVADLQEQLDMILHAACQIAKTDRGQLVMMEKDRLETRVMRGPESMPVITPEEHGVIHHVVETGEVSIIDSVSGMDFYIEV